MQKTQKAEICQSTLRHVSIPLLSFISTLETNRNLTPRCLWKSPSFSETVQVQPCITVTRVHTDSVQQASHSQIQF